MLQSLQLYPAVRPRAIFSKNQTFHPLSSMPLLRPSRDQDMDAIAAIYAHHVLHGTGTFETEAPSVQDMAARRADVLDFFGS